MSCLIKNINLLLLIVQHAPKGNAELMKKLLGDKRDIKSKMGIAVSKRGKIIIFIGREIGL